MSAATTNNIENSSESYSGDAKAEENSILTELNDVCLGMNLSPKSTITHTIPQSQHIGQHLLKQVPGLSAAHFSSSASAAVAAVHQQQNISNLQHIHNLHNQQTQNSFFNNHSTPFSVTDILSPIEESYRKLENHGNPPSPYR